MYIWKRRLGSEATYQKLIDVFERAGYCSYANIVRNTLCDPEGDNVSNDYDKPIPQPDTYLQHELSPPASPKPSKRTSLYDEYSLIDPKTANNLPKSEHY